MFLQRKIIVSLGVKNNNSKWCHITVQMCKIQTTTAKVCPTYLRVYGIILGLFYLLPVSQQSFIIETCIWKTSCQYYVIV